MNLNFILQTDNLLILYSIIQAKWYPTPKQFQNTEQHPDLASMIGQAPQTIHTFAGFSTL